MIRIKKLIKRKKNPNLKGEEFIDDKFIGFLINSFTTWEDLDYAQTLLSYGLIYKNIGDSYCEDCSDDDHKQGYISCTCEHCKECDQNICGCDLSTRSKLRNHIIHLAVKYLNKKQLIDFKNRLEFTSFENEYASYIKRLNKLIENKK